jgi:hypothetical protein
MPAAEVGTPDEAKAMATHAADFCGRTVRTKAFPAFNIGTENSMIATSTSWSDNTGKNVSTA